jgi:hypothetical protein
MIDLPKLKNRFKVRRVHYHPCIKKDFKFNLKTIINELSIDEKHNSLGYTKSPILKGINIENLIDEGNILNLKEPLSDLSKINNYNDYLEAIREYTMVDIFIVQASGITISGEILFQDDIGNKISGSVFCAQKVIILVDVNNIYSDVDEFLGQREGNVFSIIYGSMEGHKDRIHLIQIMEKI